MAKPVHAMHFEKNALSSDIKTMVNPLNIFLQIENMKDYDCIHI